MHAARLLLVNALCSGYCNARMGSRRGEYTGVLIFLLKLNCVLFYVYLQRVLPLCDEQFLNIKFNSLHIMSICYRWL